MGHRLEPTPYCTLVCIAFFSNLGYSLLTVNIFRLRPLIIKAFATDKLLSTTMAFIKLARAFATIFLNIRGLAIIADFFIFSIQRKN